MKALAAVLAAVFAVGALLFFATEQPASPKMTEADRQAIAAEIERLNLEMTRMGRPEDIGAWMAQWSPVAEDYFVAEPALFAQGVQVLTTMEAMREFFDPSRWNRQSTNMTISSSRVAVLSPAIAVQVTESPWSITNMEGETGPTYPSSVTTVWVKEDGAWKILHLHQSWTNTPIEGETEG